MIQYPVENPDLCLNVYPTYSVAYFKSSGRKSGKNNTLPISNERSGDLSRDSQRKIRKYAELIYSTAKNKKVISYRFPRGFHFKVNFITLTLPALQKHSDRYILAKGLQPFIQAMKEKFNANIYLWKAERQNKNTNGIHFHITTNQFIPWKWIQIKWNRLLSKMKWFDNDLDETMNYIKQYQLNNDNLKQPNSTDVHAVKSKEGFGIYLSKYIAKTNKDAVDSKGALSIDCKIWDCSIKLKQFKFSIAGNYSDGNLKAIYEHAINNRQIEISNPYIHVIVHKNRIENMNTPIGKIYQRELKPIIDASMQRDLYFDDFNIKNSIKYNQSISN